MQNDVTNYGAGALTTTVGMIRRMFLSAAVCLALVPANAVEIRVGADDNGDYLPSGETPADALWNVRQMIAEIKQSNPRERIILKAVNAEGKGKPVCLGCGKFRLIGKVRWDGPEQMTNRVGKSIFVGDPRSDAFFSKTEGHDWWLRRVKRNRDQIRASGGKIDLVMMGDSITHFWETRCSNSWERLVARCGTVLNCGDAGDKVNHLLWRAEGGELDGYEARAVVVLIGTNDNHFPESDPENVAKGIAHLIEVIKVKQPKARIVLTAILPRGNGKKDTAHHGARARNQKTNAIIRNLADGKRILWLDITERLSEPETGWARKDCFVDRCHPSEKGYEIWMDELVKILYSEDGCGSGNSVSAKLQTGCVMINLRDVNSEFREGAKGFVRAVEVKGRQVLEIVKTNDLGYVVVKPMRPIVLRKAVPYRTAARVETISSDPEYDCGFLRLFGARENLAHYGALDPHGRDGGLSRTRLKNVRKGHPLDKIARFMAETDVDAAMTPAIVIGGPASASSWCDWCIEEESRAVAREAAEQKGCTPRDRSADVQPLEHFRAFIKADVQHTARLSRDGDVTRLLVDERPAAPVFYRSVGNRRYGKFVYDGKDMLKSGVDLQVTDIRLGTCPQWRGYWSSTGFDAVGAADDIESSMRTAPQALFVLGICLSPYPEFSDEHPDEVHRLPDGRRLFGNYNNADTLVKDGDPAPAKLWPWISVYSTAWRTGVKQCLSALVQELKRRGIDKRVVGFHLTGFHDGQFATRRLDASAPAREAYRHWRKDLGLASAEPPTNVLKRLLSPVSDSAQVDYVRFQQRGYYWVVEDISRHLKDCFGKDVLSFRWCMSAFAGAYYGTYEVSDFIRSDTLDVLVAQATYRRREPGVACGLRLPVESFSRNGKLFVNELDLRTYAIAAISEPPDERRSIGEASSPEEWRTIHRRQVGQMLAHRQGFWYYDIAGGWFDDPPIRADIADALKVVRKVLVRHPTSWHPSAVFIIDEDGALLRNYLVYYGDCHEARLVADQLHLLASSGVPHDVCLMNDFLRDPDAFRRYRTLVFADAYSIDAARRKALESVQGDGRTLVFLGGSGYLEGAAATGFDVRLKAATDDHDVLAEPCVRENLTSTLSTLLLEKFLGGQTIGYYRCDRFATSESPKQQVMARFSKDRAVAVAERQMDGWKSVYIAEGGGLSSQYFRKLVGESGGYVPSEAGLQIDMNGDFLSVHCIRPGRYDFKLPRRCSVVSAEDGKTMVDNGMVLPLDLKTGETTWYFLR